jgi:hypothetical protein
VSNQYSVLSEQASASKVCAQPDELPVHSSPPPPPHSPSSPAVVEALPTDNKPLESRDARRCAEPSCLVALSALHALHSTARPARSEKHGPFLEVFGEDTTGAALAVHVIAVSTFSSATAAAITITCQHFWSGSVTPLRRKYARASRPLQLLCCQCDQVAGETGGSGVGVKDDRAVLGCRGCVAESCCKQQAPEQW